MNSILIWLSVILAEAIAYTLLWYKSGHYVGIGARNGNVFCGVKTKGDDKTWIW